MIPPLPESMKRHLFPTGDPNKFVIRDWQQWFSGTSFQMAKLLFAAPGGGRYTTRLIEIYKSTAGISSLLVEPFSPDMPADHWLRQPALIGACTFIEAGCAFTTQFHSVGKRTMTYHSATVYEIEDPTYISVTVTPYLHKVRPANRLTVVVECEGERFQVRGEEISMYSAKLTGKVPVVKHDDEVTPIKITLKLAELGTIKLPAQLRWIATDYYSVDWRDDVDANFALLATWLDSCWKARAEILIRRERDTRDRALKEHSGRFLDDIAKLHIFYSGGDDEWRKRLEAIGIVRFESDPDPEYVLLEAANDRVDVVFGEVAAWRYTAADLIHALDHRAETRKAPLFWVIDESEEEFDQITQQLLEAGAYDCFSSKTPVEVLRERIMWSLRAESIGKGETTVLISPDPKHCYKLGAALATGGLRVYKSNSIEAPLSEVFKLVPTNIVIDGVALKERAESIIDGCLHWAKRTGYQHRIFLLIEHLYPERATRWINNGLTDIQLYTRTEQELALRIVERIYELS